MLIDQFIENLKRAAKSEKKAAHSSKKLSFYHNEIARLSGFESWTFLLKHLQEHFGTIHVDPDTTHIRDKVNKAILKALPLTRQEYVTRDVRAFVISNFEKVKTFSAPNKNTENGYTHPTVMIKNDVVEHFQAIYPAHMLEAAINAIEEEGPWCIDDSEDMIDEFYMGSW